MRLTCPRCAAVYEVPDSAIPESGRDVQCTNCGHGWSQPHHPAGPGMAAPAPQHADAHPAVAVEPGAEADPAEADEDGVEAERDAPPIEAVRSAPVDPGLRRVLREEAEREVEARRLERRRMRAIEDGPPRERSLDQAPGEAAPLGAPGVGPASGEAGSDDDEPRYAMRPPARRASRAGGRIDPPYGEEAGLTPAASRDIGAGAGDRAWEGHRRGGWGGGFALGFLGTLAVAALLAGAYLYAEALSQAVPALAEPVAAYAQAVTEARVVVDAAARAAAGRLDDLLPDPSGG